MEKWEGSSITYPCLSPSIGEGGPTPGESWSQYRASGVERWILNVACNTENIERGWVGLLSSRLFVCLFVYYLFMCSFSCFQLDCFDTCHIFPPALSPGFLRTGCGRPPGSSSGSTNVYLGSSQQGRPVASRFQIGFKTLPLSLSRPSLTGARI